MEKKAANIKAPHLVASSTLKSSADSILSPFIPLYGSEVLGASPVLIGLIVSITSLLSIFQVFWAKIAERTRAIRPIAIITNYISGAFNFLYIVIKNIPGFISIRGFQSVIASGSVPTSSVLIAERTNPKDWGFWNSLLQGGIAFGTLTGVLLGGVILRFLPNSGGYFWIFIIAGVVSILAALLFQLSMPSKKKMIYQNRWLNVEEVEITFDNILATMKTDKNFVFLCLAGFVFIFGVNISGPFYILFNTTEYRLTIFQAAILTSISLGPQAITSILTGKFIHKIRKKELIIIGGIVTSLFPIIYIIPYISNFAGNPLLILGFMWGINGCFWGIINTSLATLILDVIHPRRRGLYLAIYNSLSAFATFIGPIIGGTIIQNSNLKYLIFIISAAIRFCGVIFFVFVKEPVIGGTILRPIRRLMTHSLRSNAERSVFILVPPIGRKRMLPPKDMVQEVEEKDIPMIENLEES